MLLPIKLRVPSIGLVLDAEIEVPDEIFRKSNVRESGEFFTDPELRLRWRKSARTLARMRHKGKLQAFEPTPGNYLYKVADIEAIEQGRGAPRQAAPRARRAV